MKYPILIVLVSLILSPPLSHQSLGQVSIEGHTVDNQEQPASFANVRLLKVLDSTLVTGTVTNMEGYFQLSAPASGDFLITISMIGYQTTTTRISVDGQQAVNLGVFRLQDDVRQLDEIVVSAQKPLYEKEADRTIVNVSSSLTATGKSALEVLEKSPGVTVNRQNNTLSMNGKTGVLVMINGKMSRLPLDAVVQMLDGMSAANIDKIELITTPPAKYDAEGDAGIINIVMVENTESGTSGNIGVTTGYNKAETFGNNFNLNHRNDGFNYFLDYSILSDRNQNSWITTRSMGVEPNVQTELTSSYREPVSTVQNIRSGMEMGITPNTDIRVLVTGYRRNWDMDALTKNAFHTSADSVTSTEMKLHETNIWQSLTGSIGLTHRLNSRQSVSVDFDYLYYDNNNPSQYDNTINSTGQEAFQELIDVKKSTPIDFRIVKLDYTNKFNNHLRLETGLKGSFSEFKNNVQVQSFNDNTWTDLDEMSNLSELNERILAGYLSLDWQPTDPWSLKGGLRYEFTDSFLSDDEQQGVVDREFGNLFPSLFTSYEISQSSKLQVAYARRLTRPTYNDMAPFVFFIGPNTFTAGNPALKPAISDGVDLSYQFKQWWISLKYSHTNNSIGWLQPEISDNDELIFRSQNLDYFNAWSLSSSLPFNVTTWWEIQSDVSLFYQIFQTSHLPVNFRETATSLNLNATNTFELPRDFSLELTGQFISRSLFGIWQFEPRGQVNIGLRKSLKNDKGTFTLNVTDILKTTTWKLKSEIPAENLRTTTEYNWNMRGVNVTYSRSFGNKKLKSVNINSGSAAERKRVN